MSVLESIVAKFKHLINDLKIPIDEIIDDKIRPRYVEEAKSLRSSHSNPLPMMQRIAGDLGLELRPYFARIKREVKNVPCYIASFLPQLVFMYLIDPDIDKFRNIYDLLADMKKRGEI